MPEKPFDEFDAIVARVFGDATVLNGHQRNFINERQNILENLVYHTGQAAKGIPHCLSTNDQVWKRNRRQNSQYNGGSAPYVRFVQEVDALFGRMEDTLREQLGGDAMGAVASVHTAAGFMKSPKETNQAHDPVHVFEYEADEKVRKTNPDIKPGTVAYEVWEDREYEVAQRVEGAWNFINKRNGTSSIVLNEYKDIVNDLVTKYGDQAGQHIKQAIVKPVYDKIDEIMKNILELKASWWDNIKGSSDFDFTGESDPPVWAPTIDALYDFAVSYVDKDLREKFNIHKLMVKIYPQFGEASDGLKSAEQGLKMARDKFRDAETKWKEIKKEAASVKDTEWFPQDGVKVLAKVISGTVKDQVEITKLIGELQGMAVWSNNKSEFDKFVARFVEAQNDMYQTGVAFENAKAEVERVRSEVGAMKGSFASIDVDRLADRIAQQEIDRIQAMSLLDQEIHFAARKFMLY